MTTDPIPDDLRKKAEDLCLDLDIFPTHWVVFGIAKALMQERERAAGADKPEITVYGNLLWRHMDACRKHGVPSPEQDRLFKLVDEFRFFYPDECKVWDDRYPGSPDTTP